MDSMMQDMQDLRHDMKQMGCPETIVNWGVSQLSKVCAKTVLQYAKGLLDVRKTLGITGFDLDAWRDITPELLMDIRKSYPELELSASWEEKTWNAVRTLRAYLINYKERQEALKARELVLTQIRSIETEMAKTAEEEQQIRLSYQRNRNMHRVQEKQLVALRNQMASAPTN